MTPTTYEHNTYVSFHFSISLEIKARQKEKLLPMTVSKAAWRLSQSSLSAILYLLISFLKVFQKRLRVMHASVVYVFGYLRKHTIRSTLQVYCFISYWILLHRLKTATKDETLLLCREQSYLELLLCNGRLEGQGLCCCRGYFSYVTTILSSTTQHKRWQQFPQLTWNKRIWELILKDTVCKRKLQRSIPGWEHVTL